jgi:hypothetical protein
MNTKRLDELQIGDEFKIPGDRIFVKIENIDINNEFVSIRYAKSGQFHFWKSLNDPAFIPDVFEVKQARGTVS